MSKSFADRFQEMRDAALRDEQLESTASAERAAAAAAAASAAALTSSSSKQQSFAERALASRAAAAAEAAALTSSSPRGSSFAAPMSSSSQQSFADRFQERRDAALQAEQLESTASSARAAAAAAAASAAALASSTSKQQSFAERALASRAAAAAAEAAAPTISSSLRGSASAATSTRQQSFADRFQERRDAALREEAAAPISSSSKQQSFADRFNESRAATLRDEAAALTSSSSLQSSRISQRVLSQQPAIFFHKETMRYGFLSNFYMPATFTDPTISRIEFSSSEKYYMAAKAAFAQNAQSFLYIMKTNDPSTAKEHGSSFRVPRDWERVRVGVMEYACYLKFSQNHNIGQALLDTGDTELVEAAPNDNVWGIGMSENQAQNVDPSFWPGTNLLGKVLMRVRNHLKNGSAPEESHIISDFFKTFSKTSSLAGVPEVNDDQEYAGIVASLTEYANSKESFDMTDEKNIRLNAFKIEQLMYDKHVADGNDPNISAEEHENMRKKIAKYIPRFIEEQQLQQLGQRQSPQYQQQQQHGIHSMGFPKADVERALAQTNGDEQRAINFLISQPQPRQPQSKYDKVTRLFTHVRQDHYHWIDREMVETALELNNYDDNQAYNYLTTQIPEPLKKDSKEIAFIREMPVRTVGGGGNCLFLSLVGSLTNLFEHLGDEVAAANPALVDEASMRKAIVNFEREHWNKPMFYEAVAINFKPTPLQPLDTSIMMDNSVRVEQQELHYGTVGKYFSLMEQDGAYGTNVELMAAALLFDVTIFVQIIEDDIFMRYNSPNPQHDKSRKIYLFKADIGGHYDWKDPHSEHGGGKQKQQKQQKQQKSRKINCKKLSKRYSRYKKNLYKYSSPTQAQKMATKYLGKTAKLYPANNPVKKYRICDPVSKKWVNFGQLGYEDYTRHKNKTRRHNYLTRTANMRGNWKSNKYSANNLSRRVLWN